MVGFEYNWNALPNDSFKQNPFYQKWSVKAFGDINKSDVIGDLGSCLASGESAATVAYLRWIIEIRTLLPE